MAAQGFCENVTVDEGIENGIRTQLHFEGDDLIIQKTFDASAHLKHAENARLATQGQNWGEGRFVVHIPEIYLPAILAIKDRGERDKAIRLFAEQNQGFIMFDKYLKTH